ncbi:MAG: class I SAM-dependent methyltransferase [Alphaproteobacteria bacterium]|nr:class I SAM-dependent methyltransferase [Alphaproteobacteria bacterium]
MSTDVIDLRDFYDSALGQIVKEKSQSILRTVWDPKASQGQNQAQNQVIVGLGYTLPLFECCPHDDKSSIFAFMPDQQGVLGWSKKQSIPSALIEEDMLPLPDRSVDRLLIVHALEHSHDPEHLLREAWRVLTSEGRLFIITPNRRGLWARFDNTPFGHGRPYTMTQLSDLLRNTLFTPTHLLRGLYTPPSNSKIIMGLSPLIEKIGPCCLQKFSGLVCIESVKQVYGPIYDYEKIPWRKRFRISLAPRRLGQPVGV